MSVVKQLLATMTRTPSQLFTDCVCVISMQQCKRRGLLSSQYCTFFSSKGLTLGDYILELGIIARSFRKNDEVHLWEEDMLN